MARLLDCVTLVFRPAPSLLPRTPFGAALALLLVACAGEPTSDPSQTRTDEAALLGGAAGTLQPGVTLPRTTAVLREAVASSALTTPLTVDVQLDGDDGFDALEQWARQHSATLLDDAPRFGDVASILVGADHVPALAHQPFVVVLDHRPVPFTTRAPADDGHTPTTRNLDSLDASNADEVTPGGVTGLDLTGLDIVLGVFDGGPIRTSHTDFAGRVVYVDPAGAFDSHATHVTGTVAGSGIGLSDARGFAPSSRVLGWTFEGRDTTDLLEQVAPRLLASNHSYGYDLGWDRNGRWVGDSGFGVYGQDARRADLAIYQYDIIWVKAAGNDAGQGSGSATGGRPADCSTGFDCLSSDGTAKNMILVAATRDLTRDPARAGDASPTAFSSRGPTDDGRVKPDIAANGDSLLSVGSSGDSDYVRLSGTSMAAPSVTGGIALIAEHMRNVLGRDPGAAEIRGLLAHTALRNDAEGRPNGALGWGLMDVRAAVDLVSASVDTPRIVHGVYDGSPLSFTLRPEDARDVELTLVWLDPAGVVNTGGRDDTTPALVNDLDLRAQTGGATFYPWRLIAEDRAAPARNDAPNRVDNLERIVIPAAQVGTTVAVTLDHAGSLRIDQPFVLIASHAVEVAQATAMIGGVRNLRLRVQNDAAPFTLPVPVTLVSGASATIAIDRGDAPFWLSIDRTSATLPGAVPQITVDARGLSPTLHYATIRIDNTSTPAARPQWFTVILDVRGLEFPQADAGEPRTVPSGAHVELLGTGSDPAGDPVTFRWTQSGGPVVALPTPDDALLRFDAPTVSEPTTLRFQLTTNNGALDSAPDEVTVTVIPTEGASEPDNNRCATAPVVSLPYSSTGTLSPVHDVDFVRFSLLAGETITASTFRRGDALDTTLGLLTFDGTVVEENDDGGTDLYSRLEARVSVGGDYCVAVSTFADLRFDGSAATEAGDYGLNIDVDRPNLPPIANAGPPQSVAGGAVVALDARGSTDPDGTTLVYAWTQASGPAAALDDPASPRPRFFAPDTDAATSVVFALEVTDADGATDTDSVTVSVSPGSAAALAIDAGDEVVVPAGARVQVPARVLGTADTIAWSSPDLGVSLTSADTAVVAFVAPEVASETTYTLEVQALAGATVATDTVRVRVLATTGANEPANNRCDTAPLVGRGALVPIRETVAGVLDPAHDVDFVRFDALEGTRYTLSIRQNGPAIRPTLGVFFADGDGWRRDAFDQTPRADRLAELTGVVASDGEVCVAVSHARDTRFDGIEADAGGPYALVFDVEPPEGANTPPIARAGDDRAVDPGALVFLDGTGSTDPEAQPLDYTWRQLGGSRTVDLFDGAQAVAQVLMPNDLATAETFRFELTVFDGVYEDRDIVAIDVGTNQRPIMSPIDRIEVRLGEPVSFVVDAGDPDGDVVRFIAEELPTTARFDADTGTFSWVADEAGFFTPRIEAVDPYGALDEVFVTVIVVDRATENRPPVVTPIADRVEDVDASPARIRLAVEATDPDGDALDYFWETSDGAFLGASAEVEAEFAYGAYEIAVFVSDGVATTVARFALQVRSATDEPPLADAGLDQRIAARSAAEPAVTVYLDGRGSADPVERGPLRYVWVQESGPEVTLTGASLAVASFEAPAGAGALSFSLTTIAEQEGREIASTPDVAFVTLEPEFVNGAPVAAIEGPAEATVGAAVTYSGAASADPDGDALSYHWAIEAGGGALRGAESQAVEATFAANDTRSWTLSLMVHDGERYSSRSARTIREAGVRNNRAPEARVRLRGVPRSGGEVTLDASGSTDADGDALSYAWVQTGGPSQTLSSASGVETRLTIDAAAGEALTFEVTVDDGEGFDTAALAFEVTAGSSAADAGGVGDASDTADAGMGSDAASAAGPESGGSGGCSASSGSGGGSAIPVAALLMCGLVWFRRWETHSGTHVLGQSG